MRQQPAPEVDQFFSLIFKWREGRDFSERPVRIRKLSGGSSRYYHRLFLGANDSDLSKLSRIVERDLPDDYVSFMTNTNGAVLFDRTMCVYGSVLNLDRSVSDDHSKMSAIYFPNRDESGEFISGSDSTMKDTIGSIAAYDKIYYINLSDDGANVTDGNLIKEFPSFSNALLSVSLIIESIADGREVTDEMSMEIQRNMDLYLS